MNLKTLLACLILLQVARADPPQQPMTWDPNDPTQMRPLIPRSQREQMGLTPHSWEGVMHPDVYPTLEKLSETTEKLKNTRTIDAINAFLSLKFQDTVYVEVELKQDSPGELASESSAAAIREVRTRVLQSLSAAEFRVQQVFQNVPGVVGYANRAGLEKMASHPEVVGICLDNKPLPEDRQQVIYKDDLPLGGQDEAANEPGVTEGKVDPDVYRALQRAVRVQVSIYVRSKEALPQLTDDPERMWEQGRLHDDAERGVQEQFLSTISADTCWVEACLGMSIWGYINKAGLEELRQHPDVQKIQLPMRFRIPESPRRTRP